MTPWALILGDRRTGKTSLARRVATTLEARNLRVVGVLQDAIEKDGDRIAYEAVRLGVRAVAERVVVARKSVAGGLDRETAPSCSYAFDDDAFARVASWLEQDAATADVIVIDEVSRAESRGRGHARAIVTALARSESGGPVVVLCVRADELVHVVEHFGLNDTLATLETGPTAGDRVLDFVHAIEVAARSRG